ncbi:uncharacterized protein LOC127351425 [Dicentrarchus labrax]|uniref:uncharacterized protein LOC127351425 n=1 Tax=Dicentrarchus labrax TaxID=13489 RepID=UPI0021F5E123|nr:uncharacterized protein LOC127351425 [Dicentrarchus labrax]
MHLFNLSLSLEKVPALWKTFCMVPCYTWRTTGLRTGPPRGTVLSPFLFTLYTSDFTHNSTLCHIQKFSDDTAIVGCVSEGNEPTKELKDAATRWLKPGGSSGERLMLEQVVLEQFVEGLPTGTAEWVRCHRPADLEAAITLAEDHLAVHGSSRYGCRSRPTGGSSGVRAGVLAVRAARAFPQGVPSHGGRTGDPGCWPTNTLPRSRRDIQRPGKDPRGYTSGNGGFGLHAVYNSSAPGSTRGFGRGIVGGH